MPHLLNASERSRVGYCVLLLCQTVLAWVLRDAIAPLITPECTSICVNLVNYMMSFNVNCAENNYKNRI